MAKYFNVYNPASQKIISKVKDYGSAETLRELNRVFKIKFSLNIKKKLKIIHKLIKQLEKKKISQDFITTIVNEVGVSRYDAIFEFNRLLSTVKSCLKILKKRKVDVTEDFSKFETKNLKYKVLRQPLKLGLGITPFNLPLILSAHKILPSLISGTPLILKPSELSPLSSIKLVNELEKCGLPKNFIKVMTTTKPEKFFNNIIKSNKIEFLSFTGSYKIGQKIKEKISKEKSIKSIFELGGMSPLIVTSNYDLKKASKLVIEGCFKYSGQRCTTARKIIVDKKIYKIFLNLLLNEINKIEKNFFSGYLIHSKFVSKLKSEVKKALKDGAKLTFGNFKKYKNPNKVSIFVLEGVKKEMEIVNREILGPVCLLIKSNNLNDSINIANYGNYNIAGSILSDDKKIINRAIKEMKVNQLNINNVPGFRSEVTPFGGSDKSGNFYKEGLICASNEMSYLKVNYFS